MTALSQMKRKDKNAVSLAGEFAVLSQLALQDYDASMTLGHTKGVDILMSDPHTKKMYRLEVKTKLRKNDKDVAKSKIFGTVVGGWIMDEKHETSVDTSLFYCFVIVWQRTKTSRFFIIPSKVVARYVREQHKLWLSEKRKEGKKVKDTEMRTLRIGFEGQEYRISTPTAEEYEDNWEFKS